MNAPLSNNNYHPDPLDLKIMGLLARNCRLPHAVIADCLRVSQNTVANRITNLEQQKIITNYTVVIDPRVFGITRHHVLMRFGNKGVDLNLLGKSLARCDSAVYIVSYVGTYDIQVIIDSHLQLPLDSVLADLFRLTNNTLSDYSVFTEGQDIEFINALPSMEYEYDFRISSDGSFSDQLSARSFPAPASFKPFRTTKLDLEILRCLAADPSASITKLSEQLASDRQTVKRHIDTLIKGGVIQNFAVGFDHQALGFHTYHLLFRLKPGIEFELISRIFRGLIGVFYCGATAGAYDLSLYVYARIPQDLMQIVSRVRSKMGHFILSYDLLIFDRVHFWRQLTPTVLKIMEQGLGH